MFEDIHWVIALGEELKGMGRLLGVGYYGAFIFLLCVYIYISLFLFVCMNMDG